MRFVKAKEIPFFSRKKIIFLLPLSILWYSFINDLLNRSVKNAKEFLNIFLYCQEEKRLCPGGNSLEGFIAISIAFGIFHTNFQTSFSPIFFIELWKGFYHNTFSLSHCLILIESNWSLFLQFIFIFSNDFYPKRKKEKILSTLCERDFNLEICRLWIYIWMGNKDRTHIIDFCLKRYHVKSNEEIEEREGRRGKSFES